MIWAVVRDLDIVGGALDAAARDERVVRVCDRGGRVQRVGLPTPQHPNKTRKRTNHVTRVTLTPLRATETFRPPFCQSEAVQTIFLQACR